MSVERRWRSFTLWVAVLLTLVGVVSMSWLRQREPGLSAYASMVGGAWLVAARAVHHIEPPTPRYRRWPVPVGRTGERSGPGARSDRVLSIIEPVAIGLVVVGAVATVGYLTGLL